ncbi:bifunctional diguanylate cyclase/phosphodiesterase [Vibrio scophthalmi]|uniref:bifunctional diguanylate cyclase/phosphodiesterase n=1 Tax=Vibrio scophthalmi TaxID=45658 RepID=UPI003EBD0950
MNALTDRKLLYTIKTVPFALIILFVILLLSLVVNDSQKTALQLEQNLIATNLLKQKETIAQRVESTYDQVRYERRKIIASLKSQVKHHVDIAYQVAMIIYQENQDKPEQDVKRMISEALRNVRYDDGNGYFFIFQTDGLFVMHATNPKQEGKQGLEMSDSQGVPYIKNFINKFTSSNRMDAYYRWWFKKPNQPDEYEKIGYGRLFEPYGWVIASGEYLQDAESQVKEKLLDSISNYRFDSDGYLFVLNKQGKVLAHKNDNLIGTHLKSVAEQAHSLLQSSNTNQGYLEYKAPYHPSGQLEMEKVSYVQYDHEWQWLIGTGVYIEDIHLSIADQLSQMREQNENEQIKVLLLCLTLALVLILMSMLLSNYLGRRFNQFQRRIEKDFAKLAQGKEQLRHQAQHDVLTHLPNRVLLERNTQRGIAFSRLQGKMLAVMFVDLDNFKRVNDKYGHEVGDELLVQTAKRFAQLAGNNGTVARFGGDEFVFSIPTLNDQAQALAFAQDIQQTLISPFVIHGIALELSASIGVSLYPNDGDQPRDLLSKADIVLTRSKKQGKGKITFFDEKIRAELQNHFLLEDEFHSALKRGELDVHYQPQVDSRSGKIIGAEALCRWYSPTLGPISPLVFIDIAEKNDAIIELGAFVLDRACRDAKQLNLHAERPITVSVNVSPKQLLHPGFVDLVLATTERYQINNHLMVLELTENVFIEDLQAVQPTLSALQQKGFSIALDDFGTGFSSLSYLNALSITEIKIDRSFIIKMIDDQSSLNIVKTIIAIARSNEINIVAEGVETLAQQTLLQQLGCTTIQGYFYSKPLPLEQLVTMTQATLYTE